MAIKPLNKSWGPGKDINYIGKDFSAFKQNLVNFTQTYFPDSYADFSEASPGTIFIDMASYVGDVLSFYQDTQLKESMLANATERKNVVALAQTMGYKPKLTSPATTTIKVYQIVPSMGSAGNYGPDSKFYLKVKEGMEIKSNNNSNIIFRTTSTNSTSTPLVERVRISAAGNVGIGTNAPDRLLALQGSGESWIRSTTTATSTQSWLFGQDGSRKGFEVYDATVSATRFFISPSSGNVGIGTTSPTASLHINANTGLLTKEILIVQGGGSPSGNYGFSVQANNGDKIFYTDNLTYHVYAGLAGGKFFVNTTTSLTNNRMHVGLGSTESFKAGSWETYTYAINNAFIMENAYFDNSFKYRISGYANAFYSDGASGAEVRVAGYGGTGDTIAWKNAATFAPNGSVYNYSNTTAWQQTSDIKIKENVNTLSNSLTTLLNLRPVTFDYKEEFSNSVNWENNDRLNNFGFIAQEFEEVFPEYVGSSERRINGEFETLKNIDTSHLVPYLVKAIQEQQTLITALQEKLERNNII